MYRKCPDCGAALDAGEACDCQTNPYHGTPYRPRQQSKPRPQIKIEVRDGIRYGVVVYERK